MKILAIDTETTGKPISWHGAVNDLDNWPRIIELAWELFDENGRTIQEKSFLIKPDGWKVPDGEFWQEHGFTTEKCEAEGTAMPEVLNYFIAAVRTADIMVAHNMSFDYPIINCEMLRYGKRAKRIETYCTKEESTPICGILGPAGKNKWPTLAEAYTFFTGKQPENAHHALADVKMCKEVYLAMQDLV